MRIVVSDSASAASSAAAAHIADKLSATNGATTLGLAGGSTPSATYRALQEVPMAWEQTTLWLSDERWVDHNHERSNTRMVRQSLSPRIARQLVVPDYTLGHPNKVAAGYAKILEAAFMDRSTRKLPDVVVLGLGTDGHTASLFAGTDAAASIDRSFVANWVEHLGEWRLTATAPLLESSTEIVFIALGGHKSAAVARIMKPGCELPAARIARNGNSVTIFVDPAAASRLDGVY